MPQKNPNKMCLAANFVRTHPCPLFVAEKWVIVCDIKRRWRGEPVCPAGASLCQNSERRKPTLKDEDVRVVRNMTRKIETDKGQVYN